MHCLICNDVITHTRMGIHSCRACAAFYSRTKSNSGNIECKDGTNECIQKNAKSSCRKCRFMRFRAVLEQAHMLTLAEQKLHKSQNTRVVQEFYPDPSSSFVDHTCVHDQEPCINFPLLSRMKNGYSLMCLIRNTSEMSTKTDSFGEFKIESMVFTLAEYSMIFPNTEIAKAAVIEFANHSFDDFRTLDVESKKCIAGKSFSILNILDYTYRLFHYFPDDMDIALPGYSTYVRNTDLDKFFENCPDDIDKKNLIRVLRTWMSKTSKIVRQYFEVFKPTTFEFAALLGLTLWSDKAVEHNASFLKIATCNRANILRELHSYYSTTGTTNYASGLGNIFCILVNCEIQSASTDEDFQLFRLMKMFDSVFPSS